MSMRMLDVRCWETDLLQRAGRTVSTREVSDNGWKIDPRSNA